MKSSEQLCRNCQEVFRQYKTLDFVNPRNCTMFSECSVKVVEDKKVKSVSVQNNVYGCSCKVRTLKNSRRKVLYCRCE